MVFETTAYTDSATQAYAANAAEKRGKQGLKKFNTMSSDRRLHSVFLLSIELDVEGGRPIILV